MKHTPGPWKFTPIPEYKPGGIACEIMANSRFGERVVARVYAWGTPAKNGAPLTEQEKKNRMEEGHANAYLVSAAPCMKSALETLLFGLTDDVTNNNGKIDFDGLIMTAKEALSKAKGE